MRITRLSIENLRNLSNARLEPGPGLNLLHGDNGAGKTTVLESILMLAKGRSFRSGAIASLLGPAGPLLRIIAEFTDEQGHSHRAGIERDREGWRGRIDGQDMRQVSEAASCFPLILMEPNSHHLVSGAPDARRRYLDWGVFHVKHAFLNTWRLYGRALKQRNAALRTNQRDLVASLDPQVVKLGEQLHADRMAVFAQLAPVTVRILGDMSPELGPCRLSYQAGWKGDNLAEALAMDLERDLEQGLTRSGPHRADIRMRVEDRAVRDRLSRGEQKILAAALLLSQAELFSLDGHTPLVLLDDLASEFDAAHLEQVVSMSRALGAQQFITGTTPRPYGFVPPGEITMFHVKQGEITVGQGH